MLFLQTTPPGVLNQFWDSYWPMLFPPFLGFVAVYWLMPRVRGSQPMLGLVAAAAAVVAGGLLLFHFDDDVRWQEKLLFYCFSGIAVVGALSMILHRNPVRAALSFAIVILATCGLFLLQGAPFLFAATIIIYAGAIVVTFLFVIMLAQQEGLSNADSRSREPFLASLTGFLLITAIFCTLQRTYNTEEIDELLDRVGQLEDATAKEDVDKILGKQTDGQLSSPLVEMLAEDFREHPAVVDAVHELDVNRNNLPELKKAAQKILAEAAPLRNHWGSLRADAKLPLSPHSGRPANAPLPKGSGELLPARNVAAIGRSLFTDYLLPVELAAVLLLVATIGAIAIAARRPEGLR